MRFSNPLARFSVSFSMSLLLLAILSAACSSGAGGQATTSTLLVQQAAPARLTYVAIGASDTFGIGSNDPDEQNWPADLARKLGSGVRLVNLGVPDIVAQQALNIELPVALDVHPGLVTIWLAVNDIIADVPPAGYEQTLNTLLSRLQAALPHVRIAIANVPDLTLLPSFKASNAQTLHAKISTYNSIIANAVARHHVLLVDLYQQWQNLAAHPEYISRDGLHPSTVGYQQIAALFYQVLEKRSS